MRRTSWALPRARSERSKRDARRSSPPRGNSSTKRVTRLTTVEEIAEAAEISKGTVYLYFGSKDELYVSVILEGFGELEKRLVAAVEGGEHVTRRSWPSSPSSSTTASTTGNISG